MATILERLRSAYEMGAERGSLDLYAPAMEITIGLELDDLQSLISGATARKDADDFRKQRDEARAQRDVAHEQLLKATEHETPESWSALCDGLTKERDALKARVAHLTSGVVVGWAAEKDGFRWFFADKPGPSYREHVVYPLFRATHTPQDVAELAAKVEALGIELAREKRMREETRKDLVAANDEVLALKARVATLLSGERLTKDALAAAEKRARTFETEAAHARGERDSLSSQLQAANIAASDKAKKLEMELAQAAEGHDFWKRAAEKAETRVVELETTTEPHSWGIEDREGGTRHFTYMSDALAAAKRGEHGDPFPLYRHPPKTGEPVAWRVSRLGESPVVTDDAAWARTYSRTNGTKIVPLYEAPPPAAIGVADERCVVLEVDRLRTVNVKGPDHLIGTRAQAEERAKALHGTAYRLVPIDAPVVDVAAIRKALSPDRNWVPTIVRAEILAAIGDR